MRVLMTARHWPPTATAASTSYGRRWCLETRRGRGSSIRPWQRTPLRRAFGSTAGDGDPAHPQIAADEHLNTAAVWDERVGDGRRIVFRTIVDKVPQPAQIFTGESAAYPAVAGNEGFWIVLWTVQGADGRSTIEGRRIASASH